MVTGASSGIGRALAGHWGSLHVRLAVVARRRERLEALADEIAASGGPRPLVIVADLSVRGAAAAVAEEAHDGLGGVDVLVNNAGSGVAALQWAGGDADECRAVMETTVWSPLALVRALVPDMRARGRGAVVNVTSMSQISPWPMLGYHSGTKAALAALTEALRLELTGSGVHVLEVNPGPVDTPVQGESRLVPGFAASLRGIPMGNPDVLARRVTRSLRRRRRRLHYPRLMAVPYAFPGLLRVGLPAQVRRAKGNLDLDDARVLVAGSDGDVLAREARDAWEDGERDLTELQRKVRVR